MNKQVPVCLTIAGSDSSGGAGIQADLRTFNYFDTHGASVITVITAQNQFKVSRILPIPQSDIIAQFEAVITELNICALKIGVLYSSDTVDAIVETHQRHIPNIPIIVDPVFRSTSGAPFAQNNVIDAIKHELLPISTLVTPNIDEAEILYGAIRPPQQSLPTLAHILSNNLRTQVLVKGGHRYSDEAIDYFAGNDEIWEFSTPYRKSKSLHGSGCILSAAIAAGIAHGDDIIHAIKRAKSYIYNSIINQRAIGKRSYSVGKLKKDFNNVVTVKCSKRLR